MSCASATQTLACVAATINGRASESRKAVARLIGKLKSVGSSGAGLSLKEGSPEGGARAEADDVGGVDGLGCPNWRGGGMLARGAVGAVDSLGS